MCHWRAEEKAENARSIAIAPRTRHKRGFLRHYVVKSVTTSRSKEPQGGHTGSRDGREGGRGGGSPALARRAARSEAGGGTG